MFCSQLGIKPVVSKTEFFIQDRSTEFWKALLWRSACCSGLCLQLCCENQWPHRAFPMITKASACDWSTNFNWSQRIYFFCSDIKFLILAGASTRPFRPNRERTFSPGWNKVFFTVVMLLTLYTFVHFWIHSDSSVRILEKQSYLTFRVLAAIFSWK